MDHIYYKQRYRKLMTKELSLWLLRVTHLLLILDNTDVLFPARYPTVIAVGSINNNLERSTFSYFGNSLDFVAPGENILSTYIGSGEEYEFNRDIYGSTVCYRNSGFV